MANINPDKFINILKKILLIGSAGLFIIIGVLGVILPLLPGIPFLIVGFALALKDDKKREKWKKKSRIYKILKREFDYIESKTF